VAGSYLFFKVIAKKKKEKKRKGMKKRNLSSLMDLNLSRTNVKGSLSPLDHRVRTGHGKPGKSWNFIISFSRPGKSWKLSIGHGKSWKMKFYKGVVQNRFSSCFFCV